MVHWAFRGVLLASGFKSRSSARSRVDIGGQYSYSSHWFPCHFQDLSTEGAGLKLNQTFIPGDVIRLKFGFRDDQRVVESTVANVNGTRVGVRFTVDPQTRTFVQTVMTAFQKPAQFRR